jgi:hypothetical protein
MVASNSLSSDRNFSGIWTDMFKEEGFIAAADEHGA